MRHLLPAAALSLTSLLAACDGGKPAGGAKAADSGPILIGHVASLTGARADFGVKVDQGVQLAFEEINAKGGVLGRRIELRTENDQSKAGEPQLAVTKLIHSTGVAAVLGEFASSASLEMAPVAQEARIPMLSPGSTDEKVTMEGDYVFRACFVNAFQGEIMSKFALEKGWKKVAILTESTSDYSTSLAKTFKKHFAAHGGAVVVERSYASGEKDFSGALSAVKAENPDAVFIPGYYNEVAAIAIQAKQAGLSATLLGGDGWSSESLIPAAGAAIEGGCFCDHLMTDDFNAKFKARFHTEGTSLAALGYDAAAMMADAIRRAGTTDGAKVRDALAQTKDFPGASGTLTLDANRNAIKPAAIITVKDGKFTPLSVVKP